MTCGAFAKPLSEKNGQFRYDGIVVACDACRSHISLAILCKANLRKDLEVFRQAALMIHGRFLKQIATDPRTGRARDLATLLSIKNLNFTMFTEASPIGGSLDLGFFPEKELSEDERICAEQIRSELQDACLVSPFPHFSICLRDAVLREQKSIDTILARHWDFQT
jgi:hypothetical protein